jgi:hypothetical protein
MSQHDAEQALHERIAALPDPGEVQAILARPIIEGAGVVVGPDDVLVVSCPAGWDADRQDEWLDSFNKVITGSPLAGRVLALANGESLAVVRKLHQG